MGFACTAPADVNRGGGGGNSIYGYCHPEGTQNMITSYEGTVPANFVYESVGTTGWLFNVNPENARVAVAGQIYEPTPFIGSNDNCKVFFFDYQRQFGLRLYTLPNAGGSEPRMIAGKLTCPYSLHPIGDDMDSIMSLGGRALTEEFVYALFNPVSVVGGKAYYDVEDVCAGADILDVAGRCRSSVVCGVEIPQGEFSRFAFSFDKDYCNKKVVQPLNGGQPVPFGWEEQIAREFVDACSPKYAQSESVVGGGGSGGGGSDEPVETGEPEPPDEPQEPDEPDELQVCRIDDISCSCQVAEPAKLVEAQ